MVIIIIFFCIFQSRNGKVQVKSSAQDPESRLVGAVRSPPLRRSLFRPRIGGHGVGSG